MRATRSTKARRPNCRKDLANVAEEGPGERRRGHLPRAEDLTAQLDDDCIGLVQAACILAMLDDVDDLRGNALAKRLRLVRRPFKLAVELTGSGQDGQLANPSSQSGLVAQIAVERSAMSRELGAVQQDTRGSGRRG